MTLISPAYTRDDLIAMINMRDELVSDLKEVCATRADRIEALEAALRKIYPRVTSGGPIRQIIRDALKEHDKP